MTKYTSHRAAAQRVRRVVCLSVWCYARLRELPRGLLTLTLTIEVAAARAIITLSPFLLANHHSPKGKYSCLAAPPGHHPWPHPTRHGHGV